MVKYRNIRIKPLVILLFSLLTLVVMSLAAYSAKYILAFEYEGLLYTLALAGVAIPIHILGKRNEALYVVAWLMNTVGIGLALSSYYMHTNADLVFGEIVPAVAVSALVLTVLCLLLYGCPHFKKPILIIVSAITALLVVAAIVFWIIKGNVFFSFSFFCLLETAVWLCVCGVTVNVKKRHILRDISFGGYGIAITVGVVVLALISEDGAGLEFLEGAEIFGASKKKRSK